jgi:acetyltransferase-like isoleucine patch superfamily enzyme
MDLKSFYSREELLEFGFEKVGDPVWVSRKTSLYGVHGSIGNHVRIDDYCILKGQLEIGSYVHISAYCCFSGVWAVVRIGDCTGFAHRVSLYSGSHDYRADALASSTVPRDMLALTIGEINVGRAVLVGAHSMVLPGVNIGDGVSVGAHCLVSQNVEAGAILVSTSRVNQTGKRDVAKILALADKVLAGSK